MRNKKIMMVLISATIALTGCTTSNISAALNSTAVDATSTNTSEFTSDENTVDPSSNTEITSSDTSVVTSSEISEITSSEVSSEASSEISSEVSSEVSSEEEVATTIKINDENSDAVEITVSDLAAKSNTSDTTTLYRTTGVVESIDSTDYGDLILTAGGKSLLVYGLANNTSSITKDGSTYTFKNDKSFSATGIVVGDTITIECLYVYYTYPNSTEGKQELVGYATSRTPGEVGTTTGGTTGGSTGGTDYTGSEVYEGDYYNSAESLTGAALADSLHDLEIDTQSHWVSYSAGLRANFPESDKGAKGGIVMFYAGTEGTSWNREHVWPQSLTNDTFGTSGAGCDIQHIRPTINNNNSVRGNKKYGTVSSSSGSIGYSTGGQSTYNSATFEPADAIKGDVARIIMYVYTHYSTEVGTKFDSYCGNLQITNVMQGSSESACFDLLRTWNSSDPVTEYERQRNNYAFSVQGNRNPFIDHPTYADAIWGNN